VGFADITRRDTILEIGPGDGILTGRLLEKAGYVTAVEIDRDLVALLREKFQDNNNFRLIEGDILAVDISELLNGFSVPSKVVSNIPYTISSPIIELLIRNRSRISDAVLMVQKEVAERISAIPGSKKYGLLTLNLALYAECRKVMNVKPGAFRPPPEVMSSVIVISFRHTDRFSLKNDRIFREITGAAFRNRRKMIRNTIVPYILSKGLERSHADTILDSAGVDPAARPETISVSAFVAMSNGLDAYLS
jgi:16S rRNA (adenine1518-N6/adenine1519-N6)-dimethyltransferase